MTIAQTPNRRPARLVRSLPFWLLLVASIAALAVGLVLTVPTIGTMTATLTDGTATGIEVYSGQAWVTVGAALIGAGSVGIALVLALGAASALVPAPVAAPAHAAPAEVAAEHSAPEQDAVTDDEASAAARG